MKRWLAVCLALLLLLLCSCEQKNQTVFEKDGYTVNTEEKTITKGHTTYRYDRSESSVTFYVGAFRHKVTDKGGTLSAQTSGPLTGTVPDLPDGTRMYRAVQSAYQRGFSVDGIFFLGLLLMVFGGFSLRHPEFFWNISYGWRFKDAEPSDAALTAEKATGVIAIIAGFILLF